MKSWITLLLLLAATSQTYAALKNTTCKSCHPAIFAEYQNSIALADNLGHLAEVSSDSL